MLSALLAALFMLGGQVAPTDIDDRWVPASLEQLIADPCEAGVFDKQGFSLAWTRVVMLERGYTQDEVCEGLQTSAPERQELAAEDLRDLTAQVHARSLVLMGHILGPSIGEDHWGPKSEELGRNIYRLLKADDYRLLREQLGSEAGPPEPAP